MGVRPCLITLAVVGATSLTMTVSSRADDNEGQEPTVEAVSMHLSMEIVRVVRCERDSQGGASCFRKPHVRLDCEKLAAAALRDVSAEEAADAKAELDAGVNHDAYVAQLAAIRARIVEAKAAQAAASDSKRNANRASSRVFAKARADLQAKNRAVAELELEEAALMVKTGELRRPRRRSSRRTDLERAVGVSMYCSTSSGDSI